MSPELTLQTREAEAKAAAAILGYRSLEFWRIPNGKLTSNFSLVKRLVQMTRSFKPDIIYVTHHKEQHPEHRAAARLVQKTLQALPKGKVPVVLMYEVWTPLQRMDHIVDITSVVAVKRLAIQAHRCQCAVMAFDEAIIGLNRYRGEMFSWPEGEYAEVFEKMIIHKRS
jgi:LmbE family N-acetylglucosaminyl deacetylase